MILVWGIVVHPGRTSKAPNSAHCLIVDKVQSLRSGILTYINLVLLPLKSVSKTNIQTILC